MIVGVFFCLNIQKGLKCDTFIGTVALIFENKKQFGKIRHKCLLTGKILCNTLVLIKFNRTIEYNPSKQNTT